MQLDADEDGEPFFKPPAIAPSPIHQRINDQGGFEQQVGQQRDSEQTAEGRTQQATAATATVEAEE